MVAKMHRMHLPKVGEGVLYIPGGVPYEAVPVAEALTRYAIGSYMRLGNKGFVYAIAGNSLSTDLGAKNSLSQKIGNVAIQADYLAGVKVITLTSNVSVEKDELAGGEVIVFPTGGAKTFTRGIVSHPAMTATATLTLTLDSPIPVDITTDGSAECIASPYSSVKSESNEWTPVMGMPTYPATVGQGVWLQVSGPSWCAPESEVGAAVNDMEVCFAGDGALKRRDTDRLGEQRAGVVICPNPTGNGQGSPFIMLNIDH